mgnify:CR=1 FL=1
MSGLTSAIGGMFSSASGGMAGMGGMSSMMASPKASGAFNTAAGVAMKLFSGPDPSSRISSAAQGPFNYGIMMQQRAIQDEMAFAEKQASLTMEEGMRDAKKKAEDVISFREEQANQYNGSGVLLEGSPMLVLEETRRRGQEEVDAIAKRATASADFIRRRAAISANSARASLLGAQNDFMTQTAATKMASAGNGGLIGAISQLFGGTSTLGYGNAGASNPMGTKGTGLYGIVNRAGTP